jgi:hypothetical protein
MRQHDTASDRTPLAHMLPRVIAGPACNRGRVLMSLLGRRDLGMGAAMAAFGESSRRCGHGLTALFDPEPSSPLGAGFSGPRASTRTFLGQLFDDNGAGQLYLLVNEFFWIEANVDTQLSTRIENIFNGLAR